MAEKERPQHLRLVGTRLAPKDTEDIASLLAAVPLEYDFDCPEGYRLLNYMHDKVMSDEATAEQMAEEAGLPPLADIYHDWRKQHDGDD